MLVYSSLGILSRRSSYFSGLVLTPKNGNRRYISQLNNSSQWKMTKFQWSGRLTGFLKELWRKFMKPTGVEPLVVFTDGSIAPGGLTGSFGIYAGIKSPLTCSVLLTSPNSTDLTDTNASDVHLAEKIAIICALKRIQDLGLDTRPVVIFTDETNIIARVEALKTKYKKFNLSEKDPEMATHTSDVVARLYENMNKSCLPRSLRKKINLMIGKCSTKEDSLSRSLNRALQGIHKNFLATAPDERMPLIESLLIPLCPYCAFQEGSGPSLKAQRYSKKYSDIVYHLAKSCRHGCVLVHVPGHSDILQNELADFLAHMGHPRSLPLPVEEIIEESWKANRKNRRGERARIPDYYPPMATVIPYEPRNCGKIGYPSSFPVCEEVWNIENGQLDNFFKRIMENGGLKNKWADNYLKKNWKDLNEALQHRQELSARPRSSSEEANFPWNSCSIRSA